MNTLKKLTIVIILTCLVCNGISFCKEPEQIKPELKFKISDGIYKIRRSSPFRQQDHFADMEMMGMMGGEPSGYQGGGYGRIVYGKPHKKGDDTETNKAAKDKKIKPTHVAFIDRNSNSNYLFAPACFEPDAILATPSGKKISELQKKFIKEGNACEVNYKLFVGSPLKMYYLNDARLFAVSQEDAQKMASAFIESWGIHKSDEINRIIKEKKEYENEAVEFKKLYEDKRNEYDKLKKTLIEKTSKNLYSPDDIILDSPVIEDSRQAAKQLNSKLVSANIEIEVIKAKLSAATVYQARTQTNKDANSKVLAKLEEIICEHTIELAGALERQKRVSKLFNEEQHFFNLFNQFNDAGYRLEAYKRKTNDAESTLKKAIEKFGFMDLSYPKVNENTAIIQPVQF